MDFEHVAHRHLGLADVGERFDPAVGAHDAVDAHRAGLATGHAEGAVHAAVGEDGRRHRLEEAHPADAAVAALELARAARARALALLARDDRVEPGRVGVVGRLDLAHAVDADAERFTGDLDFVGSNATLGSLTMKRHGKATACPSRRSTSSSPLTSHAFTSIVDKKEYYNPARVDSTLLTEQNFVKATITGSFLNNDRTLTFEAIDADGKVRWTKSFHENDLKVPNGE